MTKKLSDGSWEILKDDDHVFMTYTHELYIIIHNLYS